MTSRDHRRDPIGALMVQGASSSAGKSLLTTALARAFHRRGFDVAPFKAQNMSNNARVVNGGEIGVAQYLQALAAGVEPDVRMNPVLVKPEGDERSQVVVLGKPDLALGRLPWRARSEHLWPVIEGALHSLRADHELLLIEGAGSPAEINLRDTDLANMRTARASGAEVVLVADIDRGGAFAHLYGTWALIANEEQRRIVGFVFNKFRGDRSLLAPGPERLEQLTGIRTLGVLPFLDHGLPDEDGAAAAAHEGGRRSVAVIRYPTASNLDEFKPIEQVADLVWASSPRQIERADVVVLPGSKQVAADLDWLRHRGLEDAVRVRVSRGRPVLGICGGMQMLGCGIEDQAEVDGSRRGLALLPLKTVFAVTKYTERTTTRFRQVPPPWAGLSGKAVTGYQIRHGRTQAVGPVTEVLPDGLGFAAGPVLGIYIHGLFEHSSVLEALFDAPSRRSLEDVFDALADAVEAHLDVAALLRRVAKK